MKKVIPVSTIIIGCIFLAHLKLANIDMTKGRFFITYWKQIFTVTILTVISIAYLEVKKQQ